MGNWTTVNMHGVCSKKDLPKLKEAVCIGNDWERFGCLSHSGNSICGLGAWPAETINAIGNLSERDYGAEDVKNELQALADACPSLEMKVHIGGDYESKKCIATVTCTKGRVTLGKPEIETLADIPADQIQGRILSSLMR